MPKPEILSTAEVARLAGITPASLRTFRSRGTFPTPDGYLGSTPWWTPETVAAWLETRRRPGRPKQPTKEEVK